MGRITIHNESAGQVLAGLSVLRHGSAWGDCDTTEWQDRYDLELL